LVMLAPILDSMLYMFMSPGIRYLWKITLSNIGTDTTSN